MAIHKRATDTVGARIRHLREQRGWSQSTLARYCGWISQSRIGNYETGARRVNVDDAVVIAAALGISPGELLFGTDSSHALVTPGARTIPVLDYVQAGNYHDVDFVLYPDTSRYIHCDCPASELAFALEIRGDAMEPEFYDGDLVIVDPAVTPQPGEFVVAKVDGAFNGEATFKKYRLKANQAFELVPLNKDYPPLASDETGIHLIGTMIEHRINRRKR
ncbi:helix-turn-helix domain-containing protein [Mixta calida]|uniref:helix-turn-helix domain-containing protein n=1 Tax=Mixta calida TaxID=665913 RepID=UPI0034D3D3DD